MSTRLFALAFLFGFAASTPAQEFGAPSPHMSFSSVSVDSFDLYGGPGSLLGKFQAADLTPDWQGWSSEDLTDIPPMWQRSTFNAENLGGHGAGNHGMWAGNTAEQQPDWVAAPGYGNNWHAVLEWMSPPLSDPSTAQTVGLEFYFNHQTEVGYDRFSVEYDSMDPGNVGSTWKRVYSVSGTNATDGWFGTNFESPGVQYSTVAWEPIQFDAGGYPADDRIRIRLLLSSQGHASNEDGAWPAPFGGAQVDDINVSWMDGATVYNDFEDFEGPGPYSWEFVRPAFFGDFAKLYSDLSDLDPCRDNRSPQVVFFDDGTPPNNAPPNSAAGGGTTSPNWNYGALQGWVVTHTPWRPDFTWGSGIDNMVVSPPIAWDLPGSADDTVDGGLRLSFDAWSHVILENGIWMQPRVRASTDGGSSWLPWEELGYVGALDAPAYGRHSAEIRHLLPTTFTHLQISFGVETLLCGSFDCDDATPGPWIDNVRLTKYAGGPTISVTPGDLFQSGFAPSGSTDPTSNLKDLAVRIDAGATIGRWNGTVVPGDSLVAEILLVPGSTLARAEMKWILDVNPLFAGVRDMPPGTTVDPGSSIQGWDQWSGTVAAFATGTADLWAFDLPYEGPSLYLPRSDGPETMFFPGDRLRYAIEVEDDAGRIRCLPVDQTGFADGVGYDPHFQIRALPSFRDDGPGGIIHPGILVVRHHTQAIYDRAPQRALEELGMIEGIDFDLFESLGRYYCCSAGSPSALDNGIGSPGGHGASVDQLAEYSRIVFDSGIAMSDVLRGGHYEHRSDDVGLLTQWHDLPGDRMGIFFGDHLAFSLSPLSSSRDFLQDVLGVNSTTDSDARDDIGGQIHPTVLPQLPGLTTFAVQSSGVCDPPDGIHLRYSSDAITARPAASVGHGFQIGGQPGMVYASPVASVLHDRLVGSDRKIDVTFPFALDHVTTAHNKTAGISDRAKLLDSLFALMSFPPGSGTVSAPPVAALREPLHATPNPFNPSSVIQLSTTRSGPARVEIFDLRGRRIHTLHSGELPAGPHRWSWDGVDAGGAGVASGVYVVQATTVDGTERVKVGLLK